MKNLAERQEEMRQRWVNNSRAQSVPYNNLSSRKYPTKDALYYQELISNHLPKPLNGWEWVVVGAARTARKGVKSFMNILRETHPDVADFVSGSDALRIIPDAYFVDTENRTLYILEIEDFHLIDDNKAAKLAAIGETLDFYSWGFCVFTYYPKSEEFRVIDATTLWFSKLVGKESWTRTLNRSKKNLSEALLVDYENEEAE